MPLQILKWFGLSGKGTENICADFSKMLTGDTQACKCFAVSRVGDPLEGGLFWRRGSEEGEEGKYPAGFCG